MKVQYGQFQGVASNEQSKWPGSDWPVSGRGFFS